MAIDSTVIFVYPILSEKELIERKTKQGELTVALNVFLSGSIEYVPGSSVRSCSYPRVIIDVPYGTRFAVIPEGVI